MKKKLAIGLLTVAAFALSASGASASVILEFNQNPNDIVGGSPETIQAVPGGNIVFSLQLVCTTETVLGIDYWLSQFSGPSAGAFSITGHDLTGSDFARGGFSNATITSTDDRWSNSTPSGGTPPHPDGVPDNVLGPRNGPDLGFIYTSIPNGPGIHQVATFTLTLSPNALPGLYEIRTFNYVFISPSGWSDPDFNSHNFDAEAAIRVQVVPEPNTWLLLGLGIAVTLGLNVFRLRTAGDGG
jgi:hypothetical protein